MAKRVSHMKLSSSALQASDLIHANAWIQKAWKVACISCGEDSESAIKFKGYMRNPKTHMAWGLYQRMTLEGPDD